MPRVFRRTKWLARVSGCVVLPALAVLADCRGATQLTLEITTDFPCVPGDQTGSAATPAVQTSIIIGQSGQLESTTGGVYAIKSATTVTPQCTNERVGALVVVPSGGTDEEISVMVVSGLNVGSETCATNPKACIFARRSLRYLPHSDEPLPIVMHQSCTGQVCDPTTTCTQNGCVASACPEGELCSENNLPPAPDGGVVDVAHIKDAGPALSDGGPHPDGAMDATTMMDAHVNPVDAGPSGPVARIFSNAGHTCALYKTGAMSCWGSNAEGQLGINTLVASHTATSPLESEGGAPISGVQTVSSGGQHTCVVRTDGGLDCWGKNNDGQDEVDPNAPYATVGHFMLPHRITQYPGATALGLGLDATCVFFGAAAPSCYGAAQVKIITGNTITGTPSSASAGECHACAVYGSTLSCWGYQARGRLGNGTALTVGFSQPPIAASQVAVSFEHTCVVDTSGQVLCTGSFQNSQFQNNDCASTETNAVGALYTTAFTPVTLPAQATQVTTGKNHACALLVDATVACWGEVDGADSAMYGQIGNGTTTAQTTPVRVMLDASTKLTNVLEIVAGSAHTCARLTDRVYCWGSNSSGQLGNGGSTDSSYPVEVLGL